MTADPQNAAPKHLASGAYIYYGQYRQPYVRAAHTLFTNAPNGVTGNDDLGAMSAWYLFGAIGLAPGAQGRRTDSRAD